MALVVESRRRSSRVGYWCLEAAMVSVLLGIDDSTYRDNESYPADLADRGRALRARRSRRWDCSADRRCRPPVCLAWVSVHDALRTRLVGTQIEAVRAPALPAEARDIVAKDDKPVNVTPLRVAGTPESSRMPPVTEGVPTAVAATDAVAHVGLDGSTRLRDFADAVVGAERLDGIDPSRWLVRLGATAG